MTSRTGLRFGVELMALLILRPDDHYSETDRTSKTTGVIEKDPENLTNSNKL